MTSRRSTTTDAGDADHAPVHLLDGNVLVALVDRSHVHHPAARHWFAARVQEGPFAFATCPITQGTLLRMLMRPGATTPATALEMLALLAAHPLHRFWPDALTYGEVSLRGVIGHRQVTDAYLAGLARHHRGRLATFDRGLAALHPDVVVGIAPP